MVSVKMESKKQYFPEVDVVKGIAILLVILGHSFCQYPVNVGENFPVLASVVRSFQMPLFFMASGFLFSLNTPFSLFLKKKLRRIVIPFFVFGLLSVSLKYAAAPFTRNGSIDMAEALLGIIQGHSYWFLYTLMLLMTVSLLVKNKWMLLTMSVISISICALTDIESVNLFTIGRTVYYFPYFIFGLFLRQGYGLIKKMSHKYKIFAAFVLGLGYILAMIYGTVSEGASCYVIALLGSLMVWFSVLCLVQFNLRLLKHFGRYSLQYYLNHLLIMLPCYHFGGKTFALPILQLLTIWLLGIAVSWLMLMFEKRFAITRACCGL